ncbi:hypothetical protein [Nostoc sp. NZL]|uniref:hypothetical protein n=1 Tax=Nostoc sp. NZL TaxID=2650612 RepID=UPI0018C6F28B|nr:hypothetical protein [Nostoc sp. NZL]MBG1240996.1 hypothetical protein [Nostoc sp. NZL]
MAIKNITYQRVINLGNYESKRLELSAEILEGEGEEEAISRLMEMVERKVREDTFTKVEEEIRQRRKELRELNKEYEAVKSALETVSTGEEPDPDDIPFDQMTQTQLDEHNKNF